MLSQGLFHFIFRQRDTEQFIPAQHIGNPSVGYDEIGIQFRFFIVQCCDELLYLGLHDGIRDADLVVVVVVVDDVVVVVVAVDVVVAFMSHG